MVKFGRIPIGGRQWPDGRRVVVEARGIWKEQPGGGLKFWTRAARSFLSGDRYGVEHYIDRLIESGRASLVIGTHRARWSS